MCSDYMKKKIEVLEERVKLLETKVDMNNKNFRRHSHDTIYGYVDIQ